MMVEKTFKQIHVGDPFKLVRPRDGKPAGTRGVVTMLCKDGLTGRPMARVRYGETRGEHFVSFPTSDLDFLDGDELAEHIFARL